MTCTYCITSRIANKMAGGKSYDDRRLALIENLRSENMGYWEETTSFFLVESDADTYSFAKMATKGLSVDDDLIIVFDPQDMNAAYFGPLKQQDELASFFRSLKKLP